MIRHGHTIGTLDQVMYGATDLPLTEDGYKEIQAMAGLGVYPDPAGARLYTSGMLRTEQTFEAIYGDTEHLVVPDWREINVGKYEMQPFDVIKQDDYGRRWLSGEIEDPTFEGGDTMSEFGKRVLEGTYKILADCAEAGYDRIIAVIHGGVISFVLHGMFPGAQSNVWNWTPQPGCGYKITFEDGKPVEADPFGANIEFYFSPEDIEKIIDAPEDSNAMPADL